LLLVAAYFLVQSAVTISLMLGISRVILGATAGLHLAGLRREVAALEEQRSALRPLVGEVLRARGALHGVEERLSTLDSLAANRTRWPAIVASIADVLPLDSYVVGLQAGSGRVRLEIRARSAAAVVAAFEQSPRFQEVRLSAPVRREEGPRGSVERLVVVTRPLHRAAVGGPANGSADDTPGSAERPQRVPADTRPNPERGF
jgi:Tfp pilus assembly protein PilN